MAKKKKSEKVDHEDQVKADQEATFEDEIEWDDDVPVVVDQAQDFSKHPKFDKFKKGEN